MWDDRSITISAVSIASLALTLSVCSAARGDDLAELRADALSKAVLRAQFLSSVSVKTEQSSLGSPGRFVSKVRYSTQRAGDCLFYEEDYSAASNENGDEGLIQFERRIWFVSDAFAWWNSRSKKVDVWPSIGSHAGLTDLRPYASSDVYQAFLLPPPIDAPDDVNTLDVVQMLADPQVAFEIVDEQTPIVRLTRQVETFNGDPNPAQWEVDLDLSQLALPVRVVLPGTDLEIRVLETTNAGSLVLPSVARLAPTWVWESWANGQKPDLVSVTDAIVVETRVIESDAGVLEVAIGSAASKPPTTLEEMVEVLPTGTPVFDARSRSIFLAAKDGSVTAAADAVLAAAGIDSPRSITSGSRTSAGGSMAILTSVAGLGCAFAGYAFAIRPIRRGTTRAKLR